MHAVILVSIILCLLAAISVGLLFGKGKNIQMSSQKPLGIAFGIVAVACYISIVGFIAPQEFGWSQVPTVAEKFTERLKTGTAYQLVSSTKDEKSQVLLVKKTGTSDFRAIRVDGSVPPPEYFTLVDGKPVAIAAPAVATTSGK